MRLLARSSQNQKGQQQLCGNTDSPARGLNSTLPPHSWLTRGKKRILFLKHLYCYNTKHNRAKTNGRENQSRGINLTPCTNKPQKVVHIKNQAVMRHSLIHHIKERERESCIINMVGPLGDCWPIISLLLDDAPLRTCGVIL